MNTAAIINRFASGNLIVVVTYDNYQEFLSLVQKQHPELHLFNGKPITDWEFCGCFGYHALSIISDNKNSSVLKADGFYDYELEDFSDTETAYIWS